MTGRPVASGVIVAATLLLAAAAPVVAQGGGSVPCTPYNGAQLRRVTFDGNGEFSALSDVALMERVLTRPSSLTRRWTRVAGVEHKLNCRALVGDSILLTRLYDVSGHRGTTVIPHVNAVGRGGLDALFGVNANRVDVVFEIHETPPFVIDSVTVNWVDAARGIDTAAVRERLYAKVGRTFDQIRTTADKDSIERELKDNGYPGAVALYNHASDTVSRSASVRYEVHPGSFVRFGNITVDGSGPDTVGNPQIRNEAIRPLIGIEPGTPYSQRELLRAQRRVYGLGTHVVVQFDTTRRDSLFDVKFTLQEDYAHSFDTEYAWATLDCFRTGVHHVNKAFLHTTRQLEVSARASKLGWGKPFSNAFTRQNLCLSRFGNTSLEKDSLGSSKVNYNMTVTVSQPGSFGGRIIPSFSAYSERISGYQAFLRETLLGFAMSGSYIRSRVSTVLGYNLEYGHTDAEPAVMCFVFQACDDAARDQLTGANRRLAVLSGRTTRERLDDPVLRTNGTLLSGEVRIASPIFGSDAALTFNKATVDGSWYAPFLNDGRNVLHLRLRGGIITGGTRTGGDRLPPPQERLYTGGSNSVRGFQQNELGSVIYSIDQITIDTVGTRIDTIPAARPQRVIPIGGNSMLVGNIEYRMRNRWFPDLIEHAFFVDVGRVWTRGLSEQVGYRWIPGMGLRVFTLIGPIQLNAGYNGYDRPAGPAFYNQGISESGRAPLICVSPRDPLTSSTSSAGSCPATYVPSRSNSFWRRLVWTFAIGAG